MASSFGMYAQSELDSLQKAASTTTGIQQVNALNAYAFRLILVDYKKAEGVLAQALQLAQKENYQMGLAEAIVYQGLCENLQGKRTALATLNKGIAQAKSIQEKGVYGYGLTQIGNIYRGKAQFDSASHFYNQAYLALQDSTHPWQLSVLYRNMARLCNFQYQPKREIVFLKKSLTIREKLPDKVLLTDIYLLLSKWYLEQSDIALAKQYLAKAEKSRPSESIVEIQKDFQYQESNLLFREGRYSEALKLLQSVKEFYFSVGNKQQFCVLLLDLAELLEELGNFDISLKNGIEAIQLAEENGFKRELTRAYLIVGRSYYRIKQYQVANKFGENALRESERNNFKVDQATALNLRGLILKSQNKCLEALPQFEAALKVRKAIGDLKGVGATLGNIGECYEAMGNLKQALAIQLQSLAVKDSISHQSGLAWAYFDLASVYAKLKDVKKANFYLDKAEAKSRVIKSGVILLNIYKVRRDLFREMGRNEEALRYSILFESLNDSVINTNLTNRILSLQSAYELDKQSKEIELLSKTQQLQKDQITLQQSKIRQQQIVILSSIVGIALLSTLAYISYIYFKRTTKLNKDLQVSNTKLQAANRELYEKQEEIQVQSEELTEANHSLSILNKELAEKSEELAAQSEELRESNELISHLNHNLEDKVEERTKQLTQAYQELDTFFYRSSHDFRRPLTTFMGLAEVAKITVKDDYAISLFEKVRETAINLDRMLMKLQSISNVGADQLHFKTSYLKTIVESTLDTYKNELGQANFKVRVAVDDHLTIISYPTFIKIIFDNLVENCIHFRSDKPEISITCNYHQNGVLLSVSDNGVGIEKELSPKVFDMFFRGSELSKGNGLGLYIVKRAVDRLKGSIQLFSEPFKGTHVEVWLPMQHE